MSGTTDGMGGIPADVRFGVYPSGYPPRISRASRRATDAPWTSGPKPPGLDGSPLWHDVQFARYTARPRSASGDSGKSSTHASHTTSHMAPPLS